jgi:uncharacterized repeat protein (TIGR01451 family)
MHIREDASTVSREPSRSTHSQGRSRRPWYKRGLPLAALILAISTAPFLAVHLGGLFELGDGTGASGTGDILGSAVQPGCDWADLFNADGSLRDTDMNGTPDAEEVCGGVDAVFIADQLSQKAPKDDTVFTKGSNKNPDLVVDWEWETGNTPPKDDLSNVYSFATLNGLGELIIFAGLERLAPNGDSHVDFEFNQNPIGLDKDPPCAGDGSDGPDDGSPCEFVGTKTVNDILVVMDFEKGGDLGLVEIRKWNGTEWILIDELLGEGCTGSDFVCAFNNGMTIDGGPWPNFDNHGDPITDLLPNAFTEIGINITGLIEATPCFSTIQAHTRSSQSFTAELKDFAFGNFEICRIEVTKDGPDLSKIGDEALYTYTIENTGGAELHMHTVVDDPIGDLAAEASAAGCDPLAAGDSCTFDVPFEIPEGADDPFVNVVTIDYDPVSELSGPHLIESDDHELNLFQPCVEVVKTGDTELSKVGDPVNYTITVTNCSSDDSPNLSCNISDALLGLDKDVNLAPGDVDVTNQGRDVMEGDPDPLVNTVDVTCNVDGFPNVLETSDSHEVNLFQPCIELDKTGDTELSKVGDPVNYTITLTNCSSDDSPNLSCNISDPLLGVDKDVNLASGDVDVTNQSRDVMAGDPDPLVNTASVTCNVDGFPNVLDASDTHEVNLFQPCIELDKTGSKVGDPVDYTITATNCSSGDSPDLICNISDALLGIDKDVILVAGDVDVTNDSRVVMEGDADPLVNTASITCNVDGFPNVLDASDTHEVNLFQPCIDLDKTADTELSKVGDPVNYTITLTNCSSDDTPGLSCTVSDVLLGINKAVNLASGDVDVTEQGRDLQPGEPDPLDNTASATCNVDGFPNVLEDSDGHSVNLFQPGVEVVKECAPPEATIGEIITYTFTINNNSSGDAPNLLLDAMNDAGIGWAGLGDLTGTASANGCGSLASGGSCVFEVTRAVMVGDPDPLADVVTVNYHPDGFPNDIADDADCSVDLVGCALSPGFWGGGDGVPKWDSPADPIAVMAGFYTGTVFPSLVPSLAGSTYLEVLKFSALGDVTRQMSFKYIAARLNQATFGVPTGVDTLLNSIDAYFAVNPVGSDPQGAAQDEGQLLLGQLNAYFAAVGEEYCPDPSTF